MPTSSYSRTEMHRLAQLSPFELKAEFIALAQSRVAEGDGQKERAVAAVLSAGRGNPNWIATGPREAFYALGHFSLAESRRVWTADNLGGMPERKGIADRFAAFVRAHPDLPGVDLLSRSVELAVTRFGFEPDAWIHELTAAITADNYPVPDRMLVHGE